MKNKNSSEVQEACLVNFLPNGQALDLLFFGASQGGRHP